MHDWIDSFAEHTGRSHAMHQDYDVPQGLHASSQIMFHADEASAHDMQ